jgi:L-rhamnose-H+ transport protein
VGANPLLGAFFHWSRWIRARQFLCLLSQGKSLGLGTYWLVSGFFSWIIVLWILALLMTSDLLGVLRQAPARNIFWAYTFGVLWGLGGLTFGLTRRYLCACPSGSGIGLYGGVWDIDSADLSW